MSSGGGFVKGLGKKRQPSWVTGSPDRFAGVWGPVRPLLLVRRSVRTGSCIKRRGIELKQVPNDAAIHTNGVCFEADSKFAHDVRTVGTRVYVCLTAGQELQRCQAGTEKHSTRGLVAASSGEIAERAFIVDTRQRGTVGSDANERVEAPTAGFV